MESEGLTPSPVFKGLVKPILIAGVERPFFWMIIAVAACPLILGGNPFVALYSAIAAFIFVKIAKFISSGDDQTFEIFLDSLSVPTSLDAHSGYNAKSADHPRYK
jgi:type IV secretory pathway VirB3-like protein